MKRSGGKNTPKAILFDLDDTLISFGGGSEELWRQCCREFMADGAKPFKADELLRVLFAVRDEYWGDAARHKRGRENLILARREIVSLTFGKLGFQDEESAERLADTYSAMQDAAIHLFEGTVKTLEYFLARHVRMALITNGSTEAQRGKLKRFDLARFFDVILIDQEIGVSKPEPQIFTMALEALKLTADEVWMVGDNLVWDIQGAKAVGIYSIWADYNRVGLRADVVAAPDATIHAIDGLIGLYE